MKKTLSLVFILLILFTSISLAEEQNLIIGVWYADIEMKDGPKVPEYEQVIRIVVILTFEENGNITSHEIDYLNTNIESQEPAIIGQWQKMGKYYITKILGVGENMAYIQDEKLNIKIFDDVTYYAFRKMVPFGWYTDMKAK